MSVGPQGPQGPQGPRGLTGAAGLDGENGLQGPRGPRGERGERGEEGPAGPRGERGERGERGLDGSSAASGEYTNHLLSMISTLTAEQLRQRALIDALTLEVLSLKSQNIAQGREGQSEGKVERGERGEKGEKGESGEKGERGEKGDPKIASPCHSHYGLVSFRQISSLPPDRLSAFDSEILKFSARWFKIGATPARPELITLMNSFGISFSVEAHPYLTWCSDSSFTMGERFGFYMAHHILTARHDALQLAIILSRTISDILHFRGLELTV